MIKKYVSCALVCLLLATADFSPIAAQIKTDTDASSSAKIKANVAKRGTGTNKRVTVKMLDGTKAKGLIRQAKIRLL